MNVVSPSVQKTSNPHLPFPNVRDSWNRWQLPLLAALGCLLLYYLRFGYDYGTSDQDEIIPFLLHRLDSGLFTNDWFVQAQADAFNVREYVVLLLQGLSSILPVWISVLLVYVASWVAIAVAVFGIARMILGERTGAIAAVVLALVVTPQWTLGGNETVHSMLVPSMLAWAAGLWAVFHALKGRNTTSALLLGLATCFQVLVGLQLAGLLAVSLLLQGFDLKKFLRFGVVYLLFSMPALGPLVYQQFSTSPANDIHEVSLFYILAEFRNPHHYLPSEFPSRSYVRFGLITSAGIWGYIHLRKFHLITNPSFVKAAFFTTLLFMTTGLVCTEVFPVLFVAKLQLFKITVFARIVLITLACGAFVQVVPGWFRQFSERLLNNRLFLTGLVLSAWLAVTLASFAQVDFFTKRWGPYNREKSDLGRIETWAQAETPRDALFAIPPSVSSWRSHTKRALVINFKAFPYDDELMFSWYERLMDVAPIPPGTAGGGVVLARLDHAYENLSPARMAEIAGKYGITHFVRSTPLTPHPSFQQVYTAGEWAVYAVSNSGDGR